jgi:general nucleoside transport system ATP-binding protein
MTGAIAAEGVYKRFGPVQANAGASVHVLAGEIHAVVGENGAGKSTLMRILSGMYAPDAGTIHVEGKDVTGWSTRDAIAAGVGMVHQHFMLVPTLTVAENVVLGLEPRRGLQLDVRAAVQKVQEIATHSGLAVPPDKLVRDLTVGEAQRVEIVKTLYRGARILILDEPTAVLSPPEVQDLWRVLQQLRAHGDTIVVITHKLDEVIEISDRVTVLRHGRTITTVATRETSPAELARAMVGRDVALPRRTGGGGGAEGEVALRLREARVVRRDGTVALDRINLDVRSGEIVGIAGVEGNGQTELVEAIAGLRSLDSGDIQLFGRSLTGGARERFDAGIAHVLEDRHYRGLVLEYTVADNLILGLQHHFTRRGWLRRAAIQRNATSRIQEFDIRPGRADGAAVTLSGGNQQKIVIARELTREHSVLLASQPTRGVDVGAIESIHARLRAERAAGKAVLLVSADLNEVLALADRIAVFYRGRIAALLARVEATEDRLGEYMTGAAQPEENPEEQTEEGKKEAGKNEDGKNEDGKNEAGKKAAHVPGRLS